MRQAGDAAGGMGRILPMQAAAFAVILEPSAILWMRITMAFVTTAIEITEIACHKMTAARIMWM